MKTNLKNMSVKELEIFFETIGEKKFRAKQVFSWLFKGVYEFEDMTDLSKELRTKLEEYSFIEKLGILKTQISKKDGTRKYLFELSDGNTIEAVFLKYKFGNSLCISCQAGCRMGCTFCASAIGGLNRNLQISEMTDQIIAVEKDVKERISNVIIMGTGEPFDNYESVKGFIENINDKNGLNIGMRSITISTCGIIPKIKEVARDLPQVNLAVSLHSSNDRQRSEMMPINNKYPLAELIEAAKAHTSKTSRRITFEYALIRGINDSDKHAKELTSLLRGMLCHVNLIPLNEVAETGLKGSFKDKVEEFKKILEDAGIETTVRRGLGEDIDAACGQLRLR
jgi:23S rRNA (adenine2503-C2)-methyltransferase